MGRRDLLVDICLHTRNAGLKLCMVLGQNYQQRDFRLVFEQNSHQLGVDAHHIHLCFQARMSDQS